jgi:hypothetical protein
LNRGWKKLMNKAFVPATLPGPFSKLEIIFCVFLPRKEVLKRVTENNFYKALIPFIRVRNHNAGRKNTYKKWIFNH